MRDMGVYFEPPRRRAGKKWVAMKELADGGYGFQTEGSTYTARRFLLGSKNFSLKEVRRRIEEDKRWREYYTMRYRIKKHKAKRKRLL